MKRKLLAMVLALSLMVFPVKAQSGDKLVALTFDDGPSGRFTRRLHGYSHDSMAKMSAYTLRKELEQTAELLGWFPTLLRPPGGAYGDTLCRVAEEMDLAIINWSLDPRDWATSNSDTIVRRVVEDVRDGDVILMHDMSDSSVNAALRIIDELSAQGYRFVTVSQLARARGVGLVGGEVYTRFEQGK